MASGGQEPVRQLARAVSRAVTGATGTRPSPRTVSPKKSTATRIRTRAPATGRSPSRPSALELGTSALPDDEQAEEDEQPAEREREVAGPHAQGVPSS